MAKDDCAYLHQRAEDERQKAQAAVDPKAAAAHTQLAAAYLGRAMALAGDLTSQPPS
jgi:hypothetical protein